MDAGAQNLAADRLADCEADARAEAAADHQDEDRAERAGGRVVDLQVVEHVTGGCRAEHHADQQTQVLRERQPESAPVSVRESDDGGDDDEDIDEVDQRGLPSNTLAAPSARTSWLGDN